MSDEEDYGGDVEEHRPATCDGSDMKDQRFSSVPRRNYIVFLTLPLLFTSMLGSES